MNSGTNKYEEPSLLNMYWRLDLSIAVPGCSILSGPNASVMENYLWNLCNVGVSLVGYNMAALFIDYKWYGRKRMQVTPAL